MTDKQCKIILALAFAAIIAYTAWNAPTAEQRKAKEDREWDNLQKQRQTDDYQSAREKAQDYDRRNR